MAHLIVHRKESIKNSSTGQLFFVLVVAAALIGFMLYPMDDWKENILSTLATTCIILVVVGVALNRLNPMQWKRLFHRKKYEELIKADRRILSLLKTLTDQHYVLYDFNLELVHVGFLVLGPQGIFVVDKTIIRSSIRVEKGMLMAEKDSLQKQTGNLWRVCHLINILLKKGYNAEIMPKPILVTMNETHPDVQLFDGISLVGLESLRDEIESTDPAVIPLEQIQGFAAYLEERYFK
ncbi:MAG: hypothetical protein CSA20_06760 [Deltaproteobacteria bacterium]|nr:MAG: hypothetical protein CSA20_06760 [Deltaproteobacteria bacterium]